MTRHSVFVYVPSRSRWVWLALFMSKPLADEYAAILERGLQRAQVRATGDTRGITR